MRTTEQIRLGEVRLARAEPVLDHFAALDVLQLRTDEGAPVPGVHMLEFGDSPKLVVVLDDETGPEI